MRESYLIQNYKKFLVRGKLSTPTVDNYIVDAIYFFNWLVEYLKKQEFTLAKNKPSTYIGFVNQKAASDYKKFLIKAKLPSATANRRLAGLKKLLNFGVKEGYLINNPALSLSNIKNLNSSGLLEKFRTALIKAKTSDTTVKNYICDIRGFLDAIEEELTAAGIQSYLDQIESRYGEASRKRKLSSLRRFLFFLQETKRISADKAKIFLKILKNRAEPASRLPPEKPAHPYSHSYPHPSRRHYILYIAAAAVLGANFIFLARLKSAIIKAISQTNRTPKTQAESPTNVSIPLEAKLTDNFGIPLSYQQDISFTIYPTESSNKPLYTTGSCPVTPDDDGYLSVKIGEECGKPIGYGLFLNNPELYLGVAIGFGKELRPRYQLKKIDISLADPKNAAAAPPASPLPLPTLTRDELFLEATTSALANPGQKR